MPMKWKALKVAIIVVQVALLAIFNWYCMSSANQHTGFNVKKLSLIAFLSGSIILLLTIFLPAWFGKTDKLIIAIFCISCLFSVNILVYYYSNIFVDYDEWARRGMPENRTLFGRQHTVKPAGRYSATVLPAGARSSYNGDTITGSRPMVIPGDEETNEKEVVDIWKELERINGSALKEKTIVFDQDPDQCVDERKIIFRLENNEVVKIIDTGWFADEGWNNEYYFKRGKVFFVFEELEGRPAAGPFIKSQHRTYIKEDRIIRHIENKKNISTTTSRVIPFSYEILNSFGTQKYPSVLCGNPL